LQFALHFANFATLIFATSCKNLLYLQTSLQIIALRASLIAGRE